MNLLGIGSAQVNFDFDFDFDFDSGFDFDFDFDFGFGFDFDFGFGFGFDFDFDFDFEGAVRLKHSQHIQQICTKEKNLGGKWEFSVFSGSCLQDMNAFLSTVVLRCLGM